MKKAYKLQASEIVPLASGRGGCIATDRIVVDGAKVGYMYRERPARPLDSGWRFFAGDEDAEYMNKSEHHGIYDINTIVNYDSDILPFLDAGLGSRFERNATGKFRLLDPDE